MYDWKGRQTKKKEKEERKIGSAEKKRRREDGKLKSQMAVEEEGHGINGCNDKKDPAHGRRRATDQAPLATAQANPRFAPAED
jgi:hypothetical protein